MRYLLPLMVLLAACKGDEENNDNADNADNAGNAENADNADNACNADDTAKPGGVVALNVKYTGDALPAGSTLVVVLSTDGTQQPWAAAAQTKIIKDPVFPLLDSMPGVPAGTYYIGAWADTDKGGETTPEPGEPVDVATDTNGPVAFEVKDGENTKAPPLDLRVPGGGA